MRFASCSVRSANMNLLMLSIRVRRFLLRIGTPLIMFVIAGWWPVEEGVEVWRVILEGGGRKPCSHNRW